jgi:hypothetical protein
MTTQFRVFLNSGIKLNDKREHHGRPTMMPSFIVIHPLQLPQQDLPVGDNYITNSRHDMLFGHWVSFAEKQQRVCPYFQDFSTSSS